MGEHNLARAKALLDLHGYVDRDGDGWREQPDGRPLQLEYATSPDQLTAPAGRTVEEEHGPRWASRIHFKVAKWPEHLKASRAGKLMMWGVGWAPASPTRTPFWRWATAPTRARPTMPAST